MVTCSSCGQENPDIARFCLACAAPIAAPVPARRERRVISVLFADLVGYTRRSEHLDVEAVEQLLAPYHASLRRSVELLGGSVAKVMGDGVMALFGAVQAHDDDPERAVRCAISVSGSVPRHSDGSRALAARVGVTTGEALVLIADDGSVDAVGDVVNTAARLETAAPRNGVLVDERTHRATLRSIRYERHAAVRARGKSKPLAAWEAIEPVSAVPVQPAEDDVPLIGREREFAELSASLDRAVDEQRAVLAVLTGEPGIGKTRLLREFAASVDRREEQILLLRGRSLAYGAPVAFWALGEMVKQVAGIEDDDAPRPAAEKLEGAVDRFVAGQRDRAWVLRFLRPLVGVESEAAATGGQVDAFAAWRRFFEAIAESRPLVLAFEDLHWADDGLLDFVELLAERVVGIPMLVVGTGRPELLARRRSLTRGGSVTIRLGPITERDTGRLVAALLGSAHGAGQVSHSLAAASGGNPLYAREYVRMLADQGVVRRGEHGWQLDAVPAGVPESVQAVIAARIDTLPPAERAFLQDAAVVGRSSPLAAVCALSGVPPERAEVMVRDISARQLIRRVPSTDQQIVFTHALIQDVAYAQTRRIDRAEKHERTAEWLESAARGRDDTAELVAHHYQAALDLRRALGDDIQLLAERAGTALIAAGRQAEAVNNHAAALRHYSSAQALLPIQATVLWAQARNAYRADEAGAEALLVRAVDTLRNEGRLQPAAEAAQLLGDWHRERSGDLDAAERWWGEALRLAEQSGHAGVGVAIADGRAAVAIEQQRFTEAMAIAGDGAALGDALGDTEGSARLRVRHGYAETCSGDNRGIDRIRKAADALGKMGSRFTAGAYTDLSLAEMLTGNLRAASASCDQAAGWAARFGEPRVLGDIESRRGFFAYHAGDWKTARAISTQHLRTSNRWGLAFCLWTHALIAVAEGDEDTARADNAALRRIHAPSAANGAVAIAKVRRAAFSRRIRVEQWPHPHGYRNWDICAMAELIDVPSEQPAVAEYASTLPEATLWKRALSAAASDDYARAADVFEQIGSPWLAARAHAVAGRRNDKGDLNAARHLDIALTFFTAVGATRLAKQTATRARGPAAP